MANPKALMEHPSGGVREIQLSPDKSRMAQNKGWTKAVTWQPPVGVRRTHEDMMTARAAVEKHPQFHSWKEEEKTKAKKTPKDT